MLTATYCWLALKNIWENRGEHYKWATSTANVDSRCEKRWENYERTASTRSSLIIAFFAHMFEFLTAHVFVRWCRFHRVYLLLLRVRYFSFTVRNNHMFFLRFIVSKHTYLYFMMCLHPTIKNSVYYRCSIHSDKMRYASRPVVQLMICSLGNRSVPFHFAYHLFTAKHIRCARLPSSTRCRSRLKWARPMLLCWPNMQHILRTPPLLADEKQQLFGVSKGWKSGGVSS